MLNICLWLTFTQPSWGQTGADVLLDQLGAAPQKPTVQVKSLAAPVQLPGDVFQQQLRLHTMVQTHLSYDIRQWTELVLNNEFAKAAHLWTTVQLQIPPEFRHQAEATQLYTLWRLGLKQTFFNQWINLLADSAYAASAPEMVLQSLTTVGLDRWLMKHAIQLSPKQKTIIERLTHTSGFVLNLKAWSLWRDGTHSEDLLGKLPPDNSLAHWVAQTAVYTRLKRGDLKGAAQVLKRHIEPIIEATQDLSLLAAHDLSIARILYQAGQMPAAAEFYKKIPNGSKLYLSAREELSWVYLRQGDMSQLRGEIKALTSPLFKDRFQPEVFLLRAVSDLKMCFYDQLEKDLVDFSINNKKWAVTIDQALASAIPPRPAPADEFSLNSELALRTLESEHRLLTNLAKTSLGAVLPAVGEQKHWLDYLAELQQVQEEAKKRQSQEYTRQWKNQRVALAEAIKKMRFVKVEFLSQVRRLSQASGIDAKDLMIQDSKSVATAPAIRGTGNELSFATSTELWPDELFKLRSTAQARCLKR